MSRGRPRVSLLLGLCSALLAFSCAGAPPAPEAAGSAAPEAAAPQPAGAAETAPGVGAPLGAAPGTGGTSLATAGSPGASRTALEQRRAVEEALVFGSPDSLARAFGLISTSFALKSEDALLLAWTAARLSYLIYGEAASRFVPADFRGPGEPSTAPLARLLADAQAGRVSTPPPELIGQPLAELLPALAVFRSDSRETARLAAGALERFELLNRPSILPALIRGLDAERRIAWPEALAAYDQALARAPDAWPASLGSVRALLALQRPEEALLRIKAAPASTLELPSFLKPRAQALYETGNYAAADPLVAAALRDDPLDSHLALMRAHLLIRNRAYQQALPLLDAYATVDSSNRLYILLRAQAAEGLRSREEALRWARRGLSIYPDDPELLTVTARILFAAPVSVAGGQTAAREEARGLALRSFELTAPEAAPPAGLNPALLALRSEAGREAGRLLLDDAVARYDWPHAAQYLERVRSAPGYDNRGLIFLVLRKSGNWAAALSFAETWYAERGGILTASTPPAAPAAAVSEAEAAAEAYLRALVATKNERAALDLLPRLLAGPGSASFRSSLYYLQSQLQKTEEASLSSLRSALVENADNAEALAGMHDVYFRRKDYQKARFYLKQALALAPADPELQRRGRELDASAP